MNIDWLWQPVPELRDLPRSEQKRIWRLCAGRAMLSWQFIAAMALTMLATGLLLSSFALLGFGLRLKGFDAAWVSVLGLGVYLPLQVLASHLTMRPWVTEIRRRIRAAREPKLIADA